MSLQINKDPNGPKIISEIWSDTHALGFDMPSDSQACSLLRVLATSKSSAQLLELGSGTGLSTAWILNGMDATSHLTTIDNDPILLSVLKRHLGHDPRLSVVCADADEWLNTLAPATFDFIFADTWAGKYRLLETTLKLLRPSGIYVIDDMLPQPNWPDEHAEKVANLISTLEKREDFWMVNLPWASGVIVACKR